MAKNPPPNKKKKELQARLQAERRELADIEGETQFTGQSRVARAQAKKNIKALEDSLKFMKSPDRYNDTALTLEIPRLEYHAQQKNVGVEMPKAKGIKGIPAAVEEHSGLDNMRANQQTKRAKETRALSSSPKSKVPSAVDKYDEMGF